MLDYAFDSCAVGNPTPYYSDDSVALYHGDCRELIPILKKNGHFDCAVLDPPYGETSMKWDRWIPELPRLVATVTDSMWCFGSLRMFVQNAADFDAWKLSQDIIWEKHNGSGFHADRFKRVHESAAHWYRGKWSEIYHETPVTLDATKRAVRRKERPTHMHGRALHPTEKPSGILEPMVEYACPRGGVLLDPTAGSGSTLATAKALGRYAVGIEGDEKYCEIAAKRLQQGTLVGGAA